ncbi:anti-sigma factor family protein [Tuwongella immobilis]|uniref:: zf-HC2 n=1 Tax=Tuwongella immobilis TaxID=692036 RepID=A0A6C2YVG1_9BACT|nr:zf-HC2 domain-containing protein [Tuwongella immobilis]VIP05486.1 : zf-HC2 [Tuwongella immobilis]VTS08328.1 : zf-HC2 [Tuwongella immobilis]
MDCRTTQPYLPLLRANELDANRLAEIEAHLASCPTCAAMAAAERAFDRRMQAAMTDIAIPEGLHVRLVAKLTAPAQPNPPTLTPASAPANRPGRRFPWRVASTVAAAILAGVGVWQWSKPAPQLDAETLAISYDAQSREPFNQAIAWLADQQLRFTPAMPLDPTLVVGFEMVQFQGNTVPMLILTNHREHAVARVYIVHSRQFDLPAVRAEAQQSNCAVTVLADRDEPNRVAYVVVYTGATLDPFLSKTLVPVA